jgi:hypothetical protein
MAVSQTDGYFKTAVLACTGGLTGAIAAHPIDTIKTRMQMGLTLGQAVRSGSLLRGILSPILCVPPAWIANFVAYNTALQLTGDKTIPQIFMAGSLSGVAWASTVSPFELIKCIAQSENKSTSKVWQEYREQKVNFSLARGLPITLARDAIGLGVWFSVYHYTSKDLQWAPFFCGATCGVMNWLVIFPIDTFKTRYQTEKSTTYKESWKSMSKMISRDTSTFFKPLPVIILRNFIVAGSSMTVVEEVRKFF